MCSGIYMQSNTFIIFMINLHMNFVYLHITDKTAKRKSIKNNNILKWWEEYYSFPYSTAFDEQGYVVFYFIYSNGSSYVILKCVLVHTAPATILQMKKI